MLRVLVSSSKVRDCYTNPLSSLKSMESNSTMSHEIFYYSVNGENLRMINLRMIYFISLLHTCSIFFIFFGLKV